MDSEVEIEVDDVDSFEHLPDNELISKYLENCDNVKELREKLRKYMRLHKTLHEKVSEILKEQSGKNKKHVVDDVPSQPRITKPKKSNKKKHTNE